MQQQHLGVNSIPFVCGRIFFSWVFFFVLDHCWMIFMGVDVYQTLNASIRVRGSYYPLPLRYSPLTPP